MLLAILIAVVLETHVHVWFITANYWSDLCIGGLCAWRLFSMCGGLHGELFYKEF